MNVSTLTTSTLNFRCIKTLKRLPMSFVADTFTGQWLRSSASRDLAVVFGERTGSQLLPTDLPREVFSHGSCTVPARQPMPKGSLFKCGRRRWSTTKCLHSPNCEPSWGGVSCFSATMVAQNMPQCQREFRRSPCIHRGRQFTGHHQTATGTESSAHA